MPESFESFSIAELLRLSCRCTRCGTEMVFDVRTANYHGSECPNCGNNLFPLAQLLQAYQQLYRKAEESKLNVRLRAAAAEPLSAADSRKERK